MAALTEPEKREIVTRLARFETIAEVVADFRQRGLELHHKQVGSYDPTRQYFEAGEWALELFEGARRTYLEDVSAVPIANKAFRLNQLNEMLTTAKQTRNWKLAAELIEQASKECGRGLTHARDLSIDDDRTSVEDATPAERTAMLADLMRKALEGMEVPSADAPPETVQ